MDYSSFNKPKVHESIDSKRKKERKKKKKRKVSYSRVATNKHRNMMELKNHHFETTIGKKH